MNKKNLVFFVVFFIIGLLLSLGFKGFRNSKEKKLPASAVLTFESDKTNISPGENFLVTLNLDSQDTEVAAADFIVKFDPKYLKVVDVSTGNFFSLYPVKTISGDFIKISGIASYEEDTIVLPKGNESVGQITFQAKEKTGSTTISFDPAKTIVANSGQNILNKKSLSRLNIDLE